MSVHQAVLLTDWGDITFFPSSAVGLDAETRQMLRGRGVTVEDGAINSIEAEAEVVMTDGRRFSFAGMFTGTHCTPSTSLPEGLGCDTEETPMGIQIRTDATKETSVKGAFACGDVARVRHSVSLAVGDGAWAGIQVHRSLLWPDG